MYYSPIFEAEQVLTLSVSAKKASLQKSHILLPGLSLLSVFLLFFSGKRIATYKVISDLKSRFGRNME